MTERTKVATALAVGGCLGAAIATLALRRRAAGNAASTVVTRTIATSMSRSAPGHLAAPLPKIFIYDHCPFCVRVRMILGLKHVQHELVFLANHDEATPIGLIGSKQVPIMQLPSGKAMAESLDIVRYVDNTYGGPPILSEASDREDLKKWIKESSDVFRLLYHPRFHAGYFAEFAQHEAREYYRTKKEKTIGSFADALAKTPELVQQANQHLEALERLFASNRAVNASLSYDDIDFFGRLRGLTIVKGLEWPPKLREYLDYYSVAADVPLLDPLARN